jgi:Mce-associated membrane protein
VSRDEDIEDIEDIEDSDDSVGRIAGAEDREAAEVKAAGDDDVVEIDELDAGATEEGPAATALSRYRVLFGLVAVIVLAALAGWFGFRTFQAHQTNVQRTAFLETARQSALNLTAIDWQHPEADVNRVLGGLTGDFYDDFAARSQPFIEAVKKAQAVSVGTLIESGFESQDGDEAQVLVLLSVKTKYAGGAEEPAREWRMRMAVKKVDDQMKVSNVEFVP